MNAVNTRSRVSVALADEALDRSEATTAMCGCGFTHLCWAPETESALQDDALDRPSTARAFTRHFCRAQDQEQTLDDEALDRPDATVAMTGGLPFSWAPSAPERLAEAALVDEALDRPREIQSRFSSACFCSIDAEAREEASEPCKASHEDLGGVRPAIGCCHPSPPAEPGERPADAKGRKAVQLSDYRRSVGLDRLAA